MPSSSSCSRLVALAGRMMSSFASSASASASVASTSYCSHASTTATTAKGRAILTSSSSSSLLSPNVVAAPLHGLGAAAGVRPYIRVPVNRNNVDRALRDINRICQADDVVAAWRADRVFTRPAIRRVVERKASERRLASKRFKAHMRWVMARRDRGF